MTAPEFLNVDLDIRSRSTLEPLLNELGKRVWVLYTESKRQKHFAALETSRYWRNPTPDKTIAALCHTIEALSPDARYVWDKAHSKTFDIGLEIDLKARGSQVQISNESIRRIAALGATLTVTCYNHSNFPEQNIQK